MFELKENQSLFFCFVLFLFYSLRIFKQIFKSFCLKLFKVICILKTPDEANDEVLLLEVYYDYSSFQRRQCHSVTHIIFFLINLRLPVGIDILIAVGQDQMRLH